MRSEETHDDQHALEMPCGACFGEGGEHTDAGWEQCCVCDGSGFQTTELGKRILDLMRHNFRPMFERMQNGEDQ